MNNADDIFEGVEALDEVAALVLDQAGPEGLRQLLAHTVETGVLRQEHLLEVAERFEAAGLSEGAAIVMEAAEHAPREAEACPFNLQSDPGNYRDWHRRHRRDFTGFLLDDRDRAASLRQLR